MCPTQDTISNNVVRSIQLIRRLAILSVLTSLYSVGLLTSAVAEDKELKPISTEIPGTAIKFEMLPVPAGKVTVKDTDGKTREIQIKPFYLGKTEVTWDVYDTFAISKRSRNSKQQPGAIARPSRPYGAPDRGFGHSGYPAISLSAYSAETFCKWLSETTGKKFRLPTEAEWQYAALAGKKAPVESELEQYAWYYEDATHPVGKKKPNAWGFYDMLGNAAEWAMDLKGVPVLCGGSYKEKAEKISPEARAYQTPAWQSTDPQNPKGKWWLSDGPFAGFRIVCEP